MTDYKNFKSGTDIRGFAADGFENEKLFMSDEFVERTAFAFAVWLKSRTGKNYKDISISVGHDSRVSAARIKAAVLKALSGMGIVVKDCGLSSTPAMFMSTIKLNCDGAVQITASHHPWERNGLKFFTTDGGLEGEDIAEILSTAKDADCSKIALDKNKVHRVNFMSEYANELREMIKSGINAADYEHPLTGYKIIVDAGNGVGGFYATDVLELLGADTNGSCFLEPDGMFPNHIPNPENAQAMDAISKATVESRADLGIIFDTDVDRAGCVDKSGEEINRNRLVALAAKIALEGKKTGVIVTDSVTSDGLKEFIESLGGTHYRFMRGYRNVINKQIELNNSGKYCPLAIETSGHAAFKENYYLDDGAYLMTKIIIMMVKQGNSDGIAEILSTLKQPKEEKELRFNILCDDFKNYGNAVLVDLIKYADNHDGWTIAPDNRDGIRISTDKSCGDGWFLLRLSVHDPVMPFNIESNISDGAKIIAKDFYDFISAYDKLNTEPIEDFINE